MIYGWAGANLEIDLSQGNIEKYESDRRLNETFLGAKGINAKILWDRVPPEVTPFSPNNLLVIGTGVLTGTIVPSATRACISFKSPQTGLHHHSTLGGFWPVEIKRAGYDNIVISGKSPKPVYLWIYDNKIELRDAANIWGKGVRETKRLIQKELNNTEIQIAGIGLAGEHKVYSATLESTHGSSASRGGLGAIMGDKNLKAIVVKGTKDINIAKGSSLIKLCQQILNRTGPLREWVENFSHELNYFDFLGGFFGNLNETYRATPPEFKQRLKQSKIECQALIDRARDKEVACYNCGIRCKQAFPHPDGGYSFIKCQPWWTFMVSSKTVDYDFAIKCYNFCDEYGLDAVAVARIIAFAIELFEKGILTKKETEGMDLEWGNQEVVFSLIEKIARREGIGDVLANGISEAAIQIGRGAEEYAHTEKKLELIPSSGSVYAPYFALTLAISDKADATRNMSYPPQDTWFLSKEKREELLDSGFFPYPKEYDKYLLSDFDMTGDDLEPGCQFAAYDDETFTITDMLGLCNFWSVFFPYPPINSRALVADLISSTTGLDIDEAGLTRIARRVLNLVRAYNVRLGLRRKDDTVPKMFFQRTPSPPWVTLDKSKFDKCLDRYYELRGWNKEGIPNRETLDELGLQDVRQELEKREIL